MKYTTLFIDLDDTLIDTAQNNKEALHDIFIDYKIENYIENFDQFYSTYNVINNNLWDIYSQNKITKETLKTERFKNTLKGFIDLTDEESLKLNDNFLQRVNTKKNVIDGSIETLDYLSQKYKLYILSNGFTEVQDTKIRNAKMDSYFTKVILSDHIGINKPHPDIFTHALNEAKATNKETLMIGDNIKADVSGAKNSNIDQVWYNPKNAIDEMNIKPTYTINRLEELKAFL